MLSLKLYVSDRFTRSFNKGSLCLKNSAEGAIHDFVRRVEANPETVFRSYRCLAHLRGKARVLEIKIGGGNRLLAHYDADALTLLEVGNHEVVPRYTLGEFREDILSRRVASQNFWPGQSAFFTRYPDSRAFKKYEEETSAEWLYFLEAKQGKAFDEIAETIFEALTAGHYCPPLLIIGGPGTGKTCILLNLLKLFVDMGYETGISMSDGLTSFVERTANADLTKYRISPANERDVDLLLLDDPTSEQLRARLGQGRKNYGGTVVAAFDPLQLDEPLSDMEFDKLARHATAVYALDGCYRQKERVGRATKHVVDVVAASTPFLDESKKRNYRAKYERLTAASNELIFLNPFGHVEVYEKASVNDILKETQRILNSRWLMWRHCAGLLVVLDECELSEESFKMMEPLLKRDYVRIIDIGDIESVKGLEFQHVFIFMKAQLFSEVQNGFEGTGRRVYNLRRLLRIPFSRAKDSLVTFVID